MKSGGEEEEVEEGEGDKVKEKRYDEETETKMITETVTDWQRRQQIQTTPHLRTVYMLPSLMREMVPLLHCLFAVWLDTELYVGRGVSECVRG